MDSAESCVATDGVSSIEEFVYNPDNPLDNEDRQYDDTSDGIDWDEITATTEPDFRAGRFAFDSRDYPTHEEAMIALDQLTKEWVDEIIQRNARERNAAVSPWAGEGSTF